MKNKKTIVLLTLSALLAISSCGEKVKKIVVKESETKTVMEEKAPTYNTNDPQSILAAIEYAQGGWGDLWNKKDVQYLYDYRYPDGKADVSTERYIFKSEASFGNYTQHDINAMPGTKGIVTQYFNGTTTTTLLDNKKVKDPKAMAVSDFLRKANYFWFVMPYKLNDKGTIAKYIGQEDYNETLYDKIEITYDPDITGKEQNDIYILYVNPSTKMIDRFYFSLPFLGVNAPVIVANYKYEDIDGQKIATTRTYFMPNEKGEYSENPNIVQTLSDIKFHNGFTSNNITEI